MKNTKSKTVKLLKILIGAAWLDGIVQPEEKIYLKKIAEEYQLSDHPEIQPLLQELKTIQPRECYSNLENYLGHNSSQTDYQQLLEQISALIYSDGNVDVREARFLEKVQLLQPEIDNLTMPNRLLKKIQKLYRQAIQLN